jgi:hypothetical protein
MGSWFHDLAVRHDMFGVELIGLAEVNLPLPDNPFAEHNKNEEELKKEFNRAIALVFRAGRR